MNMEISCYQATIVWSCGHSSNEEVLCRCVSAIGRPCDGHPGRASGDLGIIALMDLCKHCEHDRTCMLCRQYGPNACIERDTTGMY